VPGTIAPEFVTSFHEYVKNLKSTIARAHIEIKLARPRMERNHWIRDNKTMLWYTIVMSTNVFLFMY